MILRTKDRDRLRDIFASVDTPLEVWAYGSRVDGTAHDGSDLDLVVRTPNLEKLPVGTLHALKDKIQNSNIPILVELFDWARLPETFHRNIEAQHEMLFSNLGTAVNEPQEDYKKKEQKGDTLKSQGKTRE